MAAKPSIRLKAQTYVFPLMIGCYEMQTTWNIPKNGWYNWQGGLKTAPIEISKIFFAKN